MKKIRNLIIVIMVFCMFTINSSIGLAAGEATPYASIVPCSSSESVIRKIKSRQTSVYKRTGQFVTPGSTYTVTTNYGTTITNSADFTLFPELFSMGYERSVEAGYNIGWSKTNKTSSVQELVILKVYDVVNAISYSNYNNGYCTVGANKTYNIAIGWAFDLR